MKFLIFTAMTLTLSLSVSAESFFQKGHGFIDTKRNAGGYIEEVKAGGKLQVVYMQGKGSYNSYRDIVDTQDLAKVKGCSTQGLGCVGDSKIIRVSDKKAMMLSISGIMQNGNITVDKSALNASEIANTKEGLCVSTDTQRVCIGDEIAVTGDKEFHQVAGLFDNGDLAIYDETIYSGNVIKEYFKIIKLKSLK